MRSRLSSAILRPARAARPGLALLALGALHAWSDPARAQESGSTERISVSSSGAQSDGLSTYDVLSADGRFVAFLSDATNLVPGDSGIPDIYVHDRQTHALERVSVSASGVPGNSASHHPDLSGDGRFVVFDSLASNLVPGDTNRVGDVFVRDRWSGALERVSVASNGAQSDGDSTEPAISWDGRYVVFLSLATQLAGADTNGKYDLYLRDRWLQRTRRLSLGPGGSEPSTDCLEPSISGDGRRAAFSSQAPELVPGDANGTYDCFVVELDTGALSIASLSQGGAPLDDTSNKPALSYDGSVLAFQSYATNAVPGDLNGTNDVFVRYLPDGPTVLASLSSAGTPGNSGSTNPQLSADGRVLAFRSYATNLVEQDRNGVPDVFVRDLATGWTARVSVGMHGAEAGSFTQVFSISADGRYVSFHCFADNLVPGDTNGLPDAFVRDRACAAPWCPLGSALAGAAGEPVLSGWGSAVPGASPLLVLSQAAPHALGLHVLGAGAAGLPLYGGELVPLPQLLVPFACDAEGTAELALAPLLGTASGFALHAQSWLLDASAPMGLAASNGLVYAIP